MAWNREIIWQDEINYKKSRSVTVTTFLKIRDRFLSYVLQMDYLFAIEAVYS